MGLTRWRARQNLTCGPRLRRPCDSSVIPSGYIYRVISRPLPPKTGASSIVFAITSPRDYNRWGRGVTYGAQCRQPSTRVTMGRMPRATTQRHPPDQLIHAIRAALLSTIWTECPEVLDDLRDSVFTPLSLWMTRDDIVALLRRYSPRVHDPRLGSAHHQVRAQIVCWARRWHINAPGMRDDAWRTLSWWARWARDPRPAGRAFGWAPLVDVDTTARLVETPTPTLRRPRDGVALIWLVRHRVWPAPASLEDLANGVTERGHVTPHAVRVAVNDLAHELDLPVRRRGRPRAARSRAPSPRA